MDAKIRVFSAAGRNQWSDSYILIHIQFPLGILIIEKCDPVYKEM